MSTETSELPAIGTVFASLDSFKATAFDAAAAGAYPLGIFTSHVDSKVQLRCTGLGHRREAARKGVDPCTCHSHVRKSPKSNGFTVRSCNNKHSCVRLDKDSEEGKEVVRKMREKAALAKKAWSRVQRDEAEEESTSTDGDEDSEANDEASKSKGEVHHSSGPDRLFNSAVLQASTTSTLPTDVSASHTPITPSSAHSSSPFSFDQLLPTVASPTLDAFLSSFPFFSPPDSSETFKSIFAFSGVLTVDSLSLLVLLSSDKLGFLCDSTGARCGFSAAEVEKANQQLEMIRET